MAQQTDKNAAVIGGGPAGLMAAEVLADAGVAVTVHDRMPSLGRKFLPYSYGGYSPEPVEIIITAATFAAMCLLYVLFAKVVPIISIWELKAGDHPSPDIMMPGAERHQLGDLHL